MTKFIFQRIFQMIFILLGVSFIVFFSMHIAPGDPATFIAGEEAPPETVEQIREDMGLNDPFFVQYGDYMAGLIQGDLGYSYQTSQNVGEAILLRLPNTVRLITAGLTVAAVLGIAIGIIAALRHRSWLDYTATSFSLLGLSIPNFWLGTMAILVFAVILQWVPVGGFNSPWFTFEGIQETIIPALTLGLSSAATIARMTRSEMLEVLGSDYIKTARSKGVREIKVYMVHALRNAMIPTITVLGLSFGVLMGGTVILEEVFAINGIGRLLVDAIQQRDFPMVQGGVLLIAATFVIINLIVDLLYIIIDPRISYGE
ncbi:ABC transporter permease [Natribacillus halophilus]|uniref:Peptide/nickel transport system permease protein n=1 Tax=Natribacillus halophilus TaxID=549003 RepID=A0A1G8R801_9BACI|nr:ABC transporter permease [Natribacillus halophilus]SDJ13102.1 peptide/nickel transport system permease protein [Natribacillus halophilus]